MKQQSIFNAEFVTKTIDKGQWHNTFHAKQVLSAYHGFRVQAGKQKKSVLTHLFSY